ncbi:hypothetical protein GIB67_009291 [Kingdonia uniflora]|uniref:Protein arginine methyltransferase NDUFAF7 n=1 Tax=Kingdonia uniflora TaxID=39325 RepID=A0A7J7N301_9MAGN|nr:hypothetical protein GIB67_009291 [Kingdonia uniflora]
MLRKLLLSPSLSNGVLCQSLLTTTTITKHFFSSSSSSSSSSSTPPIEEEEQTIPNNSKISIDRSNLCNPTEHTHEPSNTDSDLVKHLKGVIKFRGGPISVAEYMKEVLTNPKDGFYINRDVFGSEGDFITSPEVSQMFGEMVGIWTMCLWEQMGQPEKVNLIELGPGRGTLMADLLRGASKFEKFAKSLDIHMVECSPTLKKLQYSALKCTHGDVTGSNGYEKTVTTFSGTPVSWHATLEQVPLGCGSRVYTPCSPVMSVDTAHLGDELASPRDNLADLDFTAPCSMDVIALRSEIGVQPPTRDRRNRTSAFSTIALAEITSCPCSAQDIKLWARWSHLLCNAEEMRLEIPWFRLAFDEAYRLFVCGPLLCVASFRPGAGVDSPGAGGPVDGGTESCKVHSCGVIPCGDEESCWRIRAGQGVSTISSVASSFTVSAVLSAVLAVVPSVSLVDGIMEVKSSRRGAKPRENLGRTMDCMDCLPCLPFAMLMMTTMISILCGDEAFGYLVLKELNAGKGWPKLPFSVFTICIS